MKVYCLRTDSIQPDTDYWMSANDFDIQFISEDDPLEDISSENEILILVSNEDEAISILRHVRHRTNAFLFLVSKERIVNRIQMIHSGADLYLDTPSPEEITVHMLSFFNRNAQLAYHTRQNVMLIADLALYHEDSMVKKQNVKIDLTNAEYRIVSQMMLEPGRIFSLRELHLMYHVDDSFYTENSIRMIISHIRSKLGRSELGKEYIITEAGGYRFMKPLVPPAYIGL